MKRIAALLLILTCAAASAAPAPTDAATPPGWREILAFDGLLAFKAPKDVLITPHFNDRYPSSAFQAEGLRIDFWFDRDGISLGEDATIGGRPARIAEYPDFFAIFFPDVARPKFGGVGEIKGLRLNVTHKGKPEEAAAIVRSIRFSAAGDAIEKAAQAKAASNRTWKRVAAGEIMTFDAPPGLQLLESTANDAQRHRYRAAGLEVEIGSRKIAYPPAEYAGKEVIRSRFRIDEKWAEVFVKPGRMIAFFQKSLSATAYDGPVIEFRFDNFEAQENAVAILQTIRLHYLTAGKVMAATPVPPLRGASAEDQLFFAIAFTAVDEQVTTHGAEGATVEYEDDSVVVTFPYFPPVVPKGTIVTGPSFCARVLIDRASGTITTFLVG